MAKRRPKSEPSTPDIELAIPLPEDGLGSLKYFSDEIKQSEKRIAEEVGEWKKNLDRYNGARTAKAKGDAQVNADYYNTEQKKAQLLYRTPEVQVKAKREQWKVAAPIVQAVINEFMGPEQINAVATCDEAAFDLLCPAGIAAVKVGYDRVTVPVQLPTNRTEPGPIDPLTGLPGAPVPVLGADGQPETSEQEKLIWDEYYIRRISPPDVRIPAGFTSTRYEHAPWLGFKFPVDEHLASQFKLPSDSVGDGLNKDTLLSERDKKYIPSTGYGYELWYRASLIDATELNPERYRRLVLVNGRKGGKMMAVVHENSTWQEFDADGAFIKGVKGNPIRVTSLRTVGDTAYPKSDCQMSRPVVDERSRSRTQMVRAKDSARRLLGFNKNKVRKETVTQIENGEANDLIGFDGDPREQMAEISSSSTPPADFTLDSIQNQETDRIWALGANQQGVREDTTRSATEIKAIQNATDTRLAKERAKFLTFYVSLCYQVLGLIQMFADSTRTVEMIGEDGKARLQDWKNSDVDGDYAFSIKPNSAIRVDAAEEAERQLRFNNLTANNPNFDQISNARDLATAWDKDPAKLVRPPTPPPPPPPEKPKISISFKGEDFNPEMPQYNNVIQVLGHEYKLQAAAPAQGPQPGPITAPKGVPPVSKHDANLTGKPAGPPVQ